MAGFDEARGARDGLNFLLQVGGDPYSDQFCDTASATESVGPLALWRVSNPSAIQSSSKEALDPGQLKLMRRVALVYNSLLEIWGVFPPPLRMCSDRCVLTGRIYSTAFFDGFSGSPCAYSADYGTWTPSAPISTFLPLLVSPSRCKVFTCTTA